MYTDSPPLIPRLAVNNKKSKKDKKYYILMKFNYYFHHKFNIHVLIEQLEINGIFFPWQRGKENIWAVLTEAQSAGGGVEAMVV